MEQQALTPEQRQANMAAAQAALRRMRQPTQEAEDPMYPGLATASNMAQAHPGLPTVVPAVAGQLREAFSPTANSMKLQQLWNWLSGSGEERMPDQAFGPAAADRAYETEN